MTLKENNAKRTLYLLSVEEPVLPEHIHQIEPHKIHWICEKIDDNLPIIGGMYMIRSLISAYPFLTNLIRRANPTIKFQRVYGNRGKLPEPLFGLLPTTGKAEVGYNVPKTDATEDKAMRRVIRAFARDGKFHDISVRLPVDGVLTKYHLQIVFREGKHYSWTYENQSWTRLSSPWKRIVLPLDSVHADLYSRALKLFPNNPSLN